MVRDRRELGLILEYKLSYQLRKKLIPMVKKENYNRIIELLKTMKQGVKHLDRKLAEGEIKENLYLFTDLFEAFTTIETQIYENKEIEEQTAELKRAFSLITDCYEEKDYGKVRSYFLFVFRKSFDNWFKKVMEVYNDQ